MAGAWAVHGGAGPALVWVIALLVAGFAWLHARALGADRREA